MLNILGVTSERLQEMRLICPLGVMRIGQDALKRLDPRMMEHGDRVAFIACEMMQQCGGYTTAQRLEMFQLAMFHDIGAYKIEEIDRMMTFEKAEAMEHSLYGYLFMRYLSPLGDAAEPILYHHEDASNCTHLEASVRDFAQIIHIADRADLLIGEGPLDMERLWEARRFEPALIELLERTEQQRGLTARLHSGAYREVIYALSEAVCTDVNTAVAYLSMLVYVIDFKSPVTVDHTINVVAFAVMLGRLMGLDEREQCCLYLAALVHDIGKMAIPHEILENPGKLTIYQMEIMKKHVEVSNEILQGNIPDYIRLIAARHHEKPDASGYPLHLTAEELTPAQRVLAVADVMSALLGKRSYKEAFGPQKTKDILGQMARTGKLDAQICALALQNFEYLVEVADQYCQPIIQAYYHLQEEYARIKSAQQAVTIQE